MHLGQARDKPFQHGANGGGRNGTRSVERLGQAAPPHAVRDDVRGAVRLGDAVHLRDVGVVHAGQEARARQEALESRVVQTRDIVGPRTDRPVLAACSPLPGEVLGDRDLAVAARIQREIGGRDAVRLQLALDPVVPEQGCSRREHL